MNYFRQIIQENLHDPVRCGEHISDYKDHLNEIFDDIHERDANAAEVIFIYSNFTFLIEFLEENLDSNINDTDYRRIKTGEVGPEVDIDTLFNHIIYICVYLELFGDDNFSDIARRTSREYDEKMQYYDDLKLTLAIRSQQGIDLDKIEDDLIKKLPEIAKKRIQEEDLNANIYDEFDRDGNAIEVTPGTEIEPQWLTELTQSGWRVR